MFQVHIFVLACIFIIHPVVCSRKYDIETEALKLYGEDLNTVLKRFRRTPDYLKILKDKLKEMEHQATDMGVHVLYYYTKTIEERVKETLGASPAVGEATSTDAPSYIRRIPSRRQGEEGHHDGTHTNMNDEEHLKKAVKILDNYKKLKVPLTLAEKNSFIDLGFELSGRIIHTIIKNMGADSPDGDGPAKSTKGILSGDQEETTTTEHVSVHEVTTTPHMEETGSPAVDESSPGDRLRNKGRIKGRG